MDKIDRAIIDTLQQGFPLSERPFQDAGALLGLGEHELIARVQRLLEEGVLTRFGPLFQAERLGGAYALAAMQVPEEAFDRIAAQVNALPEVAHNYERDHAFNMWFVLATETQDEIARAVERIERETGLPVYLLPKREEFFVGLNLTAASQSA
jgi:DNA-binding Lrp family transcriptional regulator